jgi:hypothetical protein
MNREELNTALYEKMEAEQNTFRDWLKSQSPEEILDHAYEYSVREDMVMEMETLELTEAQAKALLTSATPLADVYRAWGKTETNHMDDVRDVIENRANDVIQTERDKLLNTPVYIHSGEYARDHGELDVFRTSYQANVACKDTLEKSINENYVDNCVNTAAIYKDAVGTFGAERVKFVLATTIQHKDWDERFSRDNRAWAQTVPMEASFGSRENDRSIYYVVDKAHTALTDLFVSHFRKEQAKEREQPKKESVLGKLQKPLAKQATKPDKDKSHER